MVAEFRTDYSLANPNAEASLLGLDVKAIKLNKMYEIFKKTGFNHDMVLVLPIFNPDMGKRPDLGIDCLWYKKDMRTIISINKIFFHFLVISG